METTMDGPLITDDEAEKIVSAKQGTTARHRTILMVLTGALVVVILTFVIMILLSLRGARTGMEALFPGLQKPTTENLQL